MADYEQALQDEMTMLELSAAWMAVETPTAPGTTGLVSGEYYLHF